MVLFYCYGDHRDLHSFPTRRSSDLRLFDELGEEIEDVSGEWMVVSGWPDRQGGVVIRPVGRAGAIHYPLSTAHCLGAKDRKSTRLNSSHEWISYAVFCLKKKNTLMILQREANSGQLAVPDRRRRLAPGCPLRLRRPPS